MLSVKLHALRGERPRDVVRRSAIIAMISFLTLIDLFGSQALLPRLTEVFDADAGTVGFVVNAATLGMAASGLVVAWFADRIDRKRGIWMCLALLAVPTALLATTENLWIFMALRIVQGVLMAAAFTLTMTYFSEQCDMMAVGGAMAAYITGNVASNLFGRLAAVSMAELVGVPGTFLAFAALNLVGAFLAFTLIGPRDEKAPLRHGDRIAAWRRHWEAPALRAAFGIGFLILFVFVGVFTYVNLHLVQSLGVAPGMLGLVYLVFAPAILTTPLAGRLVGRIGPNVALPASLGIAFLGLGLTLVDALWVVLAGLAIIGAATFFAQAAATAFVSAIAVSDRAAANGLYLTSYYFGGVIGALLLGQINTAFGWSGVAGGVGVAMGFAMILALRLRR